MCDFKKCNVTCLCAAVVCKHSVNGPKLLVNTCVTFYRAGFHENEAGAVDTRTVLQDLRLQLHDQGSPVSLPRFLPNLLATNRVALWSSDQGRDNTSHLSLACWFHPVTM